MILDSSALIAILLREPGHERLLALIAEADVVGLGAPTLTETAIVMTARLGAPGKALVARLVQEADLLVIPFADDHWPVAVDAFQRFGTGRHPAGLNFGDCLTYAIACLADQSLLCLGVDFAKTDLSVIP